MKQKLKSFEEWKKCIGKNPSKKILHYILTDVWVLKNEEKGHLGILKEEITSKLLENPSKKDLSLVINYSNNPLLQRRAWWKIFDTNPIENGDLLYIIENFPEKREAAALKLFQQSPSIYDLYRILEWSDFLREEAWEKFLNQNPTSDNFCYVIEHVIPLREKVGRMLLEKGTTTKNELLSIIMHIAELAKEAWTKFSEDKIDNYLLVHIIKFGEIESIKEKVWNKLLSQGLNERDFREIIPSKEAPLFIKEQAKILYSKGDIDES